ncbi:hypothetical protein [Brevibacillus sp. NRS-1366]|uniref:hypothetical protein n=1 Tax=Brevibacillus sp. NRS-1366 TaxID=3233899 RepID=UPI003D1D88C3
MNNIYQEAKDYKELIVRNEEEDNFQKIDRFDTMIEESAVLVFAFPNEKSIFEYFDVPKCGKLALPAISRKTDEVLKAYKMQRVRLIHLHDITEDVYEEIKDYPSVKNKIKTNTDRECFIKALAYFVARHVLVHRYRVGKIINCEVKELIGDFLDLTNADRGRFQGMHQISNKLLEGGLSPRGAMEELKCVIWTRKEELAKKAIAYNGGYLGKASKELQMTDNENELLSFNFSLRSVPDNHIIQGRRNKPQRKRNAISKQGE